MKIQSALVIAVATAAGCVAVEAYEPAGGYGGYDGEEYGTGCCSCVPTASPVTSFPTASPSAPLVYDTICSTDGGYAPEDSKCLMEFVYKSGSTSNKRTGCQPTTGKFQPYIDPKNPPATPTDGGDTTMWCSTAAIYDPKKVTKSSWGYCNCREYGCLPDTSNALISQAVSAFNSLTQVQRQKFRAVVGPLSDGWYASLPMDYSNSTNPPCYTDGGKQSGVLCKPTWTYIGVRASAVLVNGCADTAVLKPFTTAPISQPTISSTNKAKYCATVDSYDPKPSSATKNNWGYCSCLSNLETAGVNQLIATYNPLTKGQRAIFWERVKST